MSEKLTNNNIDDIFRNSIDNMETEPSENFWVNASENALFKSTQAGKKVIFRWKMLAAVSVLLLLSLSAYVFYMQKQLSNIKDKLSVVESNNVVQTKGDPNILPTKENTSVVANNNKNNVSEPVVKSVTDVQPIAELNTSKKAELAISSKINKEYSSSTTIVSNKTVHGRSSNNESEVAGLNSSASTNRDNVAAADNVVNNNENNSGISKVVSANKLADGPVTITSIDNSPIAVNDNGQNIAPNEIQPVQEYVKPAGKKSFVSKLSLSLFYEPYLSDELLENESSDIVTYNNVSANEEEVNPFSLGLKAGYDISKHISVITGCTYYSFNCSVSPTAIFAQQQSNGDAEFYFQTSVGTVQCPYGGNAKAGDGLTVSGEEKVSYIDIPLQIKYNFTPDRKLGIYLTAGLQANIVAVRKMNMQWQGFTWGQGDATEGIDGTRKLYGSYYFAPGISYRVVKGIEIFFEPSLQGSPVYSSTKGTPYVGLAGGVTYHF